ncbi:alpha-N-arabinofuranosidase [Undibacterium sp. CY18W]|uniref:non-reducing end alpha-L-arabinofuranosidase n=1 Tax=Undibacterium hunanense TaxID=2762292 RepID=A0ABR6ZMG3_9BURK|nr:alpha-L-arabinofuranosidase C-terminal domain-containing protein [Undibacterium hunanense]MBC3917096.1 alpha-N-arabinofuranosidase [Undibacterium hunanense]
MSSHAKLVHSCHTQLTSRRYLPLLVLASTLISAFASAQTTVKIDLSKPGIPVSSTLYGLMTEEINYSYDGGLYAELVRNRIFRDDEKTAVHWSLVQDVDGTASIALDTGYPVAGTALTTSLRLDAAQASTGHRVGVANDGYWGIPIKPDTSYRASFYARTAGAGGVPITVSLEGSDGKTVYAQAIGGKINGEWKQYTVTLKTGTDIKPTAASRLVLSTESPGTVWFNLVSLFPPTYKDRPNGNRIDLMQKLVDMKPAFLRFPGGNYLEGDTVATRFKWKETLGPLNQRPGHPGTWKYRSSDGMGLLEFLEWTEDMGAEPVLAVFAGYALKGETIPAGPALQPFVDEALEEIEYVMGDVNTRWGAQRARDGHPAPFKLRYVEIGNEDGFDKQKTYDGRYTQFHDAIKARYPQLKLISTVNGKDDLGQRQLLTSRVPDLIDEHYYYDPLAMMNDAKRYDTYSRSGPKIFIGEWAAREGAPTTNLISALADAAWMTGMERNADIIEMSCYAPLLVNVNPGGMQWRSNLIGYDAQTSYGSPSYHVQKMFQTYLGEVSLPLVAENIPTQTWQPKAKKDQPVPAARQVPGLFFSATTSEQRGEIYLKVVNAIGTPQMVKIDLAGPIRVAPQGKAISLRSDAPGDTNTIDAPNRIVPVSSAAHGLGSQFDYSFAPYSVTVLVLSRTR